MTNPRRRELQLPLLRDPIELLSQRDRWIDQRLHLIQGVLDVKADEERFTPEWSLGEPMTPSFETVSCYLRYFDGFVPPDLFPGLHFAEVFLLG